MSTDMYTRVKPILFQIVLAALCLIVLPGVAAPLPSEMTIMTFNVRSCRGSDGKLDIERTAAVIAAAQPRFAALQEIDVKVQRTRLTDEPAELARLTGMKATFGKTINLQGGDYGIMLLSKEEPISVTKVRLPGSEPRLLLLAEFEDCVVGCTHLSFGHEKERMESAPLIREAMAQFKKPVFLCGDWNSRPTSPVLVEMEKFLTILSPTDQNTYHGRKPKLITNPASGIDYIAIDSAHADKIRVEEKAVVQDTDTSDHKPVWVRISARTAEKQ